MQVARPPQWRRSLKRTCVYDNPARLRFCARPYNRVLITVVETTRNDCTTRAGRVRLGRLVIVRFRARENLYRFFFSIKYNLVSTCRRAEKSGTIGIFHFSFFSCYFFIRNQLIYDSLKSTWEKRGGYFLCFYYHAVHICMFMYFK